MLINDKDKSNLRDSRNNNDNSQGYGSSSSPITAEPLSFLNNENGSEFHTKNSEQSHSHDTRNKIKRLPIKAKTISFPIKKERNKFNPGKRFVFSQSLRTSFLKNNYFLESTLRLRTIDTSDKEKRDREHESKEKVNEKMDFYKKIRWTLILLFCTVLIYMMFRSVSKSF
jgi:hypothetical protein